MSSRAEQPGALSRAALLRALAEAFAYPRPASAPRIAAQFGACEAAASPALAHALARARAAWRSAGAERLASQYARLFLGSGPVSLHETAYGDGRRIAGRAAELADIAGFYTAFGFKLSEDDPDLPDHIAAELEFCSLLLVKLASAGGRGWSARRAVTERALRRFVEDHFGRWAGALAAEIGAHAPGGPYAALAGLLPAAAREEVRRLRARPTSLRGRLPRDFMQADDFSCPAASP